MAIRQCKDKLYVFVVASYILRMEHSGKDPVRRLARLLLEIAILEEWRRAQSEERDGADAPPASNVSASKTVDGAASPSFDNLERQDTGTSSGCPSA